MSLLPLKTKFKERRKLNLLNYNIKPINVKEYFNLFPSYNTHKKQIISILTPTMYDKNFNNIRINNDTLDSSTLFSSFRKYKSNSTISIHNNNNINNNKNNNSSINNNKSLNLISLKKHNFIFNEKNLKKKLENLYKDIFKDENKIFKKQKIELNNKYNLIYSDNEDEYRERLQKLNKYKLSKGHNLIHDYSIDNFAGKVKKKVETLKNKIKYMKSVIDYSYPIIVSEKNKVKSSNNKLNSVKSCPTYLEIEKKRNEINQRFKNYISNSINITNLKEYK